MFRVSCLRLLFLLFVVLPTVPVLAQQDMILTLDPVRGQPGHYSQRLNYSLPWDTVCTVHLRCYRRDSTDSLRIYDLYFEEVKFQAGSAYTDLQFGGARNGGYTHQDWLEVVGKFGLIPPGVYTTDLQLLQGKDTLYRRRLLQSVDSNLSSGSRLGRQLNGAMLVPGAKKKAKGLGAKHKAGTPKAEELEAAQAKLSRRLRPVKGMETRPETVNGRLYSALWYKGFMLGRYELSSINGLSERAASETSTLKNNASSKVQNELEDFRSIGSQVRELYGSSKQELRASGFVDLSTFRATGMDPNSAIAPDYSEVLIHTDIDFKGLPVSIEGFYTTQDQHRQAKASYIRFHYDAEKAKAKLQQLIGGYKNKMTETVSKGAGLEQVYGNYADNLDAQKEQLLKGLGRAYGLDPGTLNACGGDISKLNSLDTAALLQEGKNKATEASGAKNPAGDMAARKQKIEERRKEILEKYQQVCALAEKVDKYRTLLAQYRDQNRLDSALNYSKVKALEGKDPSYKDMAKAASGLLPEGKAKTFAAGLTSFDLGIINKYESDYTMAGQTLKGISLGYDLGPLKATICGGSTEYASREGNVDRYSSVLLRLDSKGLKNQKLSLIYNGNTPSRSLMQDDKFIGSKGISYPSFTSPVHVVSLVYEALALKKNLELHAEWAGSYRNGSSLDMGMDRLALNNSLSYRIPNTGIELKGEWEHLGRNFENNTLPYIRSATDRYSGGLGLDLFRSFLSLNLVYNYMLQQNFSTTAYSQKWGFDIRTHSRRYPNVTLSYKPFSTFRSYADTLHVAQRPLLGEVWTGRSSYQYKRNRNIHRFTLLYNSNRTSGSDSTDYNSSTAQAGYTYTRKGMSLGATMGRIELPAGFSSGTGLMSSYIFTTSITKTISPTLELSLSPEGSFCAWGLQRLSATTGIMYRFAHKPLQLRALLRISQYKLKETDTPAELYAGQLGLVWQFKLPKEQKDTSK